MKNLFLFLCFVFCILSVNAEDWVMSHTNLPYEPLPTGNIPIGDQYGMVMKGSTVCYAGGSGGWITTDLGANWTKVLNNTLYIYSVAIHPTTNDIYFTKTKTADSCYIVKTSNNGADLTTVKKYKSSASLNEIVVTNAGTVLAFAGPNMMGTSIIYRSENGGTDWTEITLLYASATQVKVYGDTILMAAKGDYGGMYYSVDDGKTFTRKSIITTYARATHAICKAPNGDIYVSAYPANNSGSTKGEIYKSSDFGDNWTVMYATTFDYTPIYDIEARPNGEIYACMLMRGIIKSENNGSSWTVANTDGQMELGVGANGRIYGIKGGYLCYLGAPVTGINTINSSSVYTAYPNPTTDEIQIASIKAPTHYEIISLDGVVVRSNTTNGTISLHGLAAGTYMVKIDQTTLKVIKQ